MSTTPGPENRPPWRRSPVNVALVIVTPSPAISWASRVASTPGVLRSTTDHVAAEAGDPALTVMAPVTAIAADRRRAACGVPSIPPDVPSPEPPVEVPARTVAPEVQVWFRGRECSAGGREPHERDRVGRERHIELGTDLTEIGGGFGEIDGGIFGAVELDRRRLERLGGDDVGPGRAGRGGTAAVIRTPVVVGSPVLLIASRLIVPSPADRRRRSTRCRS